MELKDNNDKPCWKLKIILLLFQQGLSLLLSKTEMGVHLTLR